MGIQAVGRILQTSKAATHTVVNSVTGTTGNDLFTGIGDQILSGGQGDDTYYLWSAGASVVEKANQGVDTIVAEFWGAATLPNNVENLTLAGPGSIAGTGNALDNIITAGSVGATLDGLGGNDVLIGGTGGDVFKITAGNGSDTIVNFTSGHDAIELDNYGIKSFDQLLAMGKQVGADTWFTLPNHEQLVLQNTKLSSLHSFDFGLPFANQSSVPAGMTLLSGPGQAQNWHGWYAINNAWGVGTMQAGVDYTLQTEFNKSDMTAGTTFTWSMPNSTSLYPSILAYPEVSFGVPPLGNYSGDPTDTAAVFPVKVSDLVSVTADYDVSFTGQTGGFDVAYDIWLTKVPNGDKSTVSNEVMVWLHKGDFSAFGTPIGTYQDGDFTATIYHQGTYTAIVADHDTPKGDLDIAKIIAQLQSLGIVSGSEYLASVELGAEVVSGTGSLTINNLDLTVSSHAADGGIITKTVTGSGTTVHEDHPANSPFTAGTAAIVDAHGVTTGTQVTTVSGNTATEKTVALNGQVLGIDIVTAKGDGTVTTDHYTAAGGFLGEDVVNPEKSGTQITDHYDSSWKLLGADSVTHGANGLDTITHYDAHWAIIDNETVQTKGNQITTDHYDAHWKFTGADIETDGAAGSVTVQHYDSHWAFTGEDATTLNNGVATTIHYTANWAFNGEEVEQAAANGVVSTTVYDSSWKLVDTVYQGTMNNDAIQATWTASDIHGGLGSDTLTGGSGADRFHFDTAIGNGDVDNILNFSTANDKIVLDQSIFSGIKSLGQLAASAFVTGTAAHDSDDRIIFDPKTHSLYYDPDGSGSAHAVLIAHVQADHALTAANIAVIG